MSELSAIFRQNHIPKKSMYHDCVDTGADLALTASTEIAFPCDCVTLNDYNIKILFDSATSNIKDTIDDALLFVKLKMTVNAGIGEYIHIKYTIPNPLGDILIDEQLFYIPKNNIDYPITAFNLLYNGVSADAKTNGFNVSMYCTGSATLKARSVLVGVV